MSYLGDSAGPKREKYSGLKDLKVIQNVELPILDMLDSQTLNDLQKKLSGAARVLEGIQELMSIKNKYLKDLSKARARGANIGELNKTYGNASRAAIRAVVEDAQAFESLKGPVSGLEPLEGRLAIYADILKNNEELRKKQDPDKKTSLENSTGESKASRSPKPPMRRRSLRPMKAGSSAKLTPCAMKTSSAIASGKACLFLRIKART